MPVPVLIAAALLGPFLPSAATASSPRIHYTLHCQGCHLTDGRGVPGTIPPLTAMGKFLTVPGGRAFLVRVPGTAQAPLGDSEIAELLNWMLLRFSPEDVPDDFRPYTAEEVAEYRKTRLTEVEAVRRELVEAIERSR